MSVDSDLSRLDSPWFWQALKAIPTSVASLGARAVSGLHHFEDLPVLGAPFGLGARAVSWLHSVQDQVIQAAPVVEKPRDLHLELHVSLYTARSDLAKAQEQQIEVVHLIGPLTQIYQKSIALLNEIKRSYTSSEEMAKVQGMFTKGWTDIDNQLSRMQGASLHLFCGCQIEPMPRLKRPQGHFEQPELRRVRDARLKLISLTPEQRALPDIEDPITGKRVWSVNHALGGGHHGVQVAFAKRIADQGGHVYFADGAEEILLPEDRVYQYNHGMTGPSKIEKLQIKLFGLRTWFYAVKPESRNIETQYDIVRFFLDNGCHRVLRLLDGQNQRNPELSRRGAELMKLHMISRGAELAMASYARHLEAIHMAAGDLGIGLAAVCPDFDSSTTGEILERRINPRSYMLLCTDIHRQAPGSDIVRKTLERAAPDVGTVIDVARNTLYSGLPVSDIFLQDFDPVELREIYKVDRDSQFVMILGGGSTTDSLEMLDIAKHFSLDASKKVHVVKLCGGNKEALARNIQAFQKEYGKPTRSICITEAGPVTFYNFRVGADTYSVVGRVEQQVIAELMTLARSPIKDGREGLVISTKAGGGTSREIAATAVRALMTANEDIIGWEVNNRKILQAMGCATTYQPDTAGNIPLLRRMDQLLAQPQTLKRRERIQALRAAAKRSPELSMRVLRRILTETSLGFATAKAKNVDEVKFWESDEEDSLVSRYSAHSARSVGQLSVTKYVEALLPGSVLEE